MDSHKGPPKERVAANKRDAVGSVRDGPGSSMMRRCQECRRAGSLRSDTIDLCEVCDAAIAEEVQQRVQMIKAALREIKEEEQTLSAKLGRWDLILMQAKTLSRYEERGILTTCPPPSTLLQDFRAMREALVQTG